MEKKNQKENKQTKTPSLSSLPAVFPEGQGPQILPCCPYLHSDFKRCNLLFQEKYLSCFKGLCLKFWNSLDYLKPCSLDFALARILVWDYIVEHLFNSVCYYVECALTPDLQLRSVIWKHHELKTWNQEK